MELQFLHVFFYYRVNKGEKKPYRHFRKIRRMFEHEYAKKYLFDSDTLHIKRATLPRGISVTKHAFIYWPQPTEPFTYQLDYSANLTPNWNQTKSEVTAW